MPSQSPVLRVGATLAALLISGFFIREVFFVPAQPKPRAKSKEKGCKTRGRKLGVIAGNDYCDGSPGLQPNDARLRAAEAAQARATTSNRRAAGALGRLLQQQKRQTISDIMRQQARDERRRREFTAAGEEWS
ncbi:hypothetical protein N8I77_001457 [Diaporthe amygdali]|uniref:Uncharacterized protein n=1 Tax=Phomopsis amygdali TaxID=1214568 RepID=A0AAD9SQQ2_PHOAM|nr:hypothetical protein N8I77_001457 [Diaporthe amygdali]